MRIIELQIRAAFFASVVACAAPAADPTALQDLCGGGYLALRAVDSPSALAHTPRGRVYPGAFEIAGVSLKVGTPLPPSQKEDGIYIYLVVRRGDSQSLIWSLRAPGESEDQPGKNLATHDSLYQRALADLGPTVEVIAAGQAVLANGQVARIDNRSFTRRGDAARLGIGEEALKAAGLKFVDEGDLHTQRIDFNKAENPDWNHHASAEELANLRSQQDSNIHYKMSAELIRAWHQSIYERFAQFRHPSIPGMIDEGRLFNAERLFPEGKMTFEEKVALLETKDVFRILQREGIEQANHYLLSPEYDSFGNVPTITRMERFRTMIQRALRMPP